MQTWVVVWTLTWIIGMVIFAFLSVAITVYGAKDLLYLLRSLKARHDAETSSPPAEGDG